MPKYMAPGTPEYEEAEQEATRKRAILERRQWRELRDTYARCVKIARQVWDERLEEAAEGQLMLAEMMRDRATTAQGGSFTSWVKDHDGVIRENVPAAMLGDRAIPVPLFTPRDQEQFIKEVATTLLISADRKNLTVQFPSEAERETDEAPEAASGADEEDPAVEDAPADPPEGWAVPLPEAS